MGLGHDFYSCKLAHPPQNPNHVPMKVRKQKEAQHAQAPSSNHVKASSTVPKTQDNPSSQTPEKSPAQKNPSGISAVNDDTSNVHKASNHETRPITYPTPHSHGSTSDHVTKASS